MKVLAIGSDRSIFNPKSASATRQVAYGAQFDELHILIFTLRSQLFSARSLSVGVHVYPTRSRFRLWYGWDALRLAWRLSKPDVVSVQDPFEAGLIGWVIACARWSRFHVQVHTDVCAPAFRESSFLNRLRYHVARFVLHRADRIRVVSSRTQESILKEIAPRVPIVVLPIFTHVEKFKNAFPGELAHRFRHFGKKIVVVARLEAEKNVALALDSFVKSAPSDACLIIVGDGTERRALEKRAAILGQSARIFFEGTTDALPYYALADLVLAPSLFEGYGLVIVEALATGKPVLANDVGIAREAGAIATDAAHFADSLKEWFENGPRTGTLQHYQYQSFEEYVQAYTNDIKAAAQY